MVCTLAEPMRAVGQPDAPGFACRFWARGLRDPAAPRGLFAPGRVPFQPDVGRRYLVVLYELPAPAVTPGADDVPTGGTGRRRGRSQWAAERPQDESKEGLA